MALADLTTPWGENLPSVPWDVHPHPQMKRDRWLNLNGLWDFTVNDTETPPESYDQTILVPFCPESRLSGIQTHFPEGSFLWYRRRISLPEAWLGGRVLLHIGAADQILECYVNGMRIGAHSGGYEAITFDITGALKGENELVFRVRDDLRNRAFPYGKQVLKRGGMWYTPVSGIWQTVWLEQVPQTYIKALDIQVTLREATVRIDPPLSGFVTLQGGGHIAMLDGIATISPRDPQVWTPENPYLYGFTIQAGEDRVSSYFALRTLEIREVKGVQRLCLNGEPYFFHGLLDQGYWPDGLLTAPGPEAYYFDIMEMKRLGFNTLRKHIKVEPEEFYYQCDRLGMVVFQDMVSNSDYSYVRDTVLPTIGWQVWPDKWMHRNREHRAMFLAGMEATVKQLKNHPCICCWTIFNEGWGQFEASKAYEMLKNLDGSRFIDSTSGWFRWGKTDVDSRHIYFGQWWQLKKSGKPLVLSEFGGFTCMTEGHLFNPDHAYGYRTCTSPDQYQRDLEALYREHILPAVSKGLCAAIYTQVSDVEDEINGLVTYDRRVIKANPVRMRALAQELREAL